MAEGRIDARSQRRDAKRSREYVTVCGDAAYVQLTHGQVSVIDAADAPDVGESLWHLGPDGYANGNIKTDGKWTTLALHRQLLDPPPGTEVDHINGNRLDNRRTNLRACSRFENQHNSKPRLAVNGRPVSCQYKGVSVLRGKYQARIKVGGRCKYIGKFPTALAAALAYDKAARELHGEFARTNFKYGNGPVGGFSESDAGDGVPFPPFPSLPNGKRRTPMN